MLDRLLIPQCTLFNVECCTFLHLLILLLKLCVVNYNSKRAGPARLSVNPALKEESVITFLVFLDLLP